MRWGKRAGATPTSAPAAFMSNPPSGFSCFAKSLTRAASAFVHPSLMGFSPTALLVSVDGAPRGNRLGDRGARVEVAGLRVEYVEGLFQDGLGTAELGGKRRATTSRVSPFLWRPVGIPGCLAVLVKKWGVWI